MLDIVGADCRRILKRCWSPSCIFTRTGDDLVRRSGTSHHVWALTPSGSTARCMHVPSILPILENQVEREVDIFKFTTQMRAACRTSMKHVCRSLRGWPRKQPALARFCYVVILWANLLMSRSLPSLMSLQVCTDLCGKRSNFCPCQCTWE